MKGKITAIVLCSLLLGLVIFLPAATAQQAVPELRTPLSMGSRFVGTYVAETDAFPPADPEGWPTLYAFHTLSADGTMTGTNTNCCGRAGNLQSPLHGVWEKTGSREATLTGFGFVYDLDGNLIVTARIVEVLTFDADYETAEGVSKTELWLGPAVPDFEADPHFLCVGPWTDSWTRLHHAAPCE